MICCHSARRVALVLTVVGMALVPATASASIAAVEPDAVYGATLTVQEGAGTEINQVTVARTAGAYVITDSAGVTPGAGCAVQNATTVSCALGSGVSEVRNLAIGTFDGDDTMEIATTVTNLSGVWLDGGDGNDTITGGPTDDLITGGAGNDLLRGGDGDDELEGDEGWDTFIAGAGDDLVNTREDSAGPIGGPDGIADCGAGTDRVATDLVDDSRTLPLCEEISPRITSEPRVSGGLGSGRTLTVKNLTATGTPEPDMQISWLSCASGTETAGCITRAVSDSYVLQAADVGRYLRAGVNAINGDVQALGFYAQASTLTAAVGPVYAPLSMAPIVVRRPPDVIYPPFSRKQTPVLAAGESKRLLGRPVKFLSNVGPLATYAAAAGLSPARVRAGRTAKVFAMVCMKSSCEVTITRELRFRSRGAASGATRRVKLPGQHFVLARGQSSVLSLRLTRAQRLAARNGRAVLRVTMSVHSWTGSRTSNFARDVRIRAE
jgi:hypothetical protein